MATWADVRRCAGTLPETTEQPERRWSVRGRAFVFERPLRPADRAALGDRAPADAPLGLWIEDLGVKEALLASEPDVWFTTPHFDGYPLVLGRLDALEPDELAEVVTDAWLVRAPVTLRRRWLAEHPPTP
ncbi:MmcQ/YjbR family DNA-binding protein [Cellulomonas cellasea]|uniref:MmcQ/YjbR family DNA-binding protein n=1 Tax=Cellulomonas cellasea TaxID=43670 RepID=A0A7W4UG92_9CELL|nr:MmcQ/YjbR family DNA-binding protein [Cellulomonas cellasea]MBB2923028.1 hypothetical protein [Cellulomonas cellasea]